MDEGGRAERERHTDKIKHRNEVKRGKESWWERKGGGKLRKRKNLGQSPTTSEFREEGGRSSAGIRGGED